MVVLVGRRPEPLKEVAGRIVDAGGAAHVFPADIRDWGGSASCARRSTAGRARSTCW
jgi:short-subunit dehydrogenase